MSRHFTFILFTLFLLPLVGGACKGTPFKKISLENQKQKTSYALGQQIGMGMKTQGFDIDRDILMAAIGDALDGKESRMSQDEMQKTMIAMRKEMTARRMMANSKEKDQTSQKNLAAGNDFLEKNKQKKGIEVTKSGLQYEILKKGKGTSPTATDKVKVHYRGTLIDGKEFDSSYKRNKPAEFPVNRVIKGWTEALQLMKPGGKWKLYIPSDLGYGANGNPRIPGHSVLIFDVELLEVLK